MNVIDLFSGIGGFSLGLERAGMRTIAFCEAKKYCRLVLRKHWPHVPIYERVETLTADRLARDGVGRADLICGGFPCQDISRAGTGNGLDGGRSGLWREFARIIGEFRPRYALIENVAALRSRGLDRVLTDLAALGFDAEWHCIPACAVGAPHARDRIWIIAYAQREQLWDDQQRSPAERVDLQTGREAKSRDDGAQESMARPIVNGPIPTQWPPEPDVGRVADGIPARMDRLKALGNSLLPQIPEFLGRYIIRHLIVTSHDDMLSPQ